MAVATGTLVVGLTVPFVAPVEAQTVPQSTIVSDNPANFTPNVLDGKVEAFAQVGNLIIAGGSFTQVQNSTGGTTYTRSNIVAFNAATGIVSTTFAPTVSGEVFDIEPSGDGSTVYVSGQFTSVNGSTSNRVARLDVNTGAKVTAFSPPAINGIVKNIDLVNGQLLVGGTFTSVGGVSRGALASLNPTTGARTDFLALSASGQNHGGGTQVIKMAAAPDGTRLVVIGNFTAIAGQTRLQIAMVDLTTSPATLSSWSTGFYTDSCASVFNTYMRDLDFAPDSSYFVVTTTGAYRGSDSPCDVITRWETDATGPGQQATWRDYTGGDTTYAVAVTGAAVYVGGHFRWMNNPYAGDAQGPGGVPRAGIAALDPVSGLPLSWNPGRDRGVGVFDILATSTGIWVGSDTDRIGGETHRKIAFFPLAGGTTPPAQKLGTLPDDVYTLGQGAGQTDPDVYFRANAGGPEIQSADDGPDWMSQQAAAAVPGLVTGAVNSAPYSGGTAGPTVPNAPTDRAPAALFDSEAWGSGTGSQEMGWHVPVASGQAVTVRLYFANRYSGTSQPGARVYDVTLDGQVVLPDFDPTATFGDQVGGMRSFDITSDGTVDIGFVHHVENPLINGIEIIRTGSQPNAVSDNVDSAAKRSFDGTSAGAPSAVTSTAAWGSSRGAFLVDGTLYAVFADGTLTSRPFNPAAGSPFGAATTVSLYGGSFGSDIPNLTGLTYANGRLYYTRAGDSTLHWRWFSPESGVVGAMPYNADGANAALSPTRVRGMFLSGTTLYFVDGASGDLYRIGLSGTTVSGSATLAEATQDWRARSIFLGNSGATPPANQPPVAQASVTCNNLGCTFSSAGSMDPENGQLTYSWDFGDGTSSTAANPTHSYATAGNKTVTLTVRDPQNAPGSVTITAQPTSAPVPPVAGFSAGCAGLTCAFSNTSTGTGLTYDWDFGDGSAHSSATSPQHLYGGAGTYSVTLTVTGSAGTDAVTHSVTVSQPTSDVVLHGAATNAANATSVTIPKPTSTVTGDTLVMFATNNTGADATATPAGWTLVGEQADGSDVRTLVYARTAPAGPLGSLTWTKTSKTTVTVVAYGGAAAVPSGFAATEQAASSTAFTTPGGVAAPSGAIVLSYFSFKGATAPTWTAGPGLTPVPDATVANTGGGLVSSFLATEGPVGAGATAARTATSSVASAKGTTWTVVLSPA